MLRSLLLLSSLAFSVVANAGNCELRIAANDAMQFSTQSLEVDKSCKSVKLTHTHSGNLPINVMGHNWVLTASADVKDIAIAGMQAGVENRYVPAGDPRVLAATEVVGGGSSTTIEFSTAQLSTDKAYKFFCSFPGHFAVMQGDFKLI